MLVKEAEGETRRMVLVDNPLDALRLKRAGVNFDRLNLGNLTTGQAIACLSRSVALGDESLQAVLNIVEEGVRVNSECSLRKACGLLRRLRLRDERSLACTARFLDLKTASCYRPLPGRPCVLPPPRKRLE